MLEFSLELGGWNLELFNNGYPSKITHKKDLTPFRRHPILIAMNLIALQVSVQPEVVVVGRTAAGSCRA